MTNEPLDGQEAVEGGGGRRGRRTPNDPRGAEQLAAAFARVVAGDRDAFAEVYDALAPRVLGVARGVLRNPSLAEEVMQEVLVEVWRQAPQYDPSRASVATWALTIAHRRAVDRVRSVQASVDREDRVAATSTRREYDEVAEEVLQRDDESRLRAALAGVTDLQREALVMAYWGGRTSTEISTELGVPVPTVKTRLRDGLRRLRTGLEQGGTP